MNGSITTSDGRKLAFRRDGSGQLLLCHPGGPGFSGATLGDLGGLAQDVELLVIDPRGTGASDPPPDDRAYRQEDYVADLEELRQELGAEQIDLLGHSHGGFVAMAYAAAHPKRVRRLVLVATAPRFAREYDERVRALWEASDDPAIAVALDARLKRMARSHEEDDERMRLRMLELRLYFRRAEGVEWLGGVFGQEPPNLAALMLFNAETAPQYDNRAGLPLIEAPTLVISGELDFFDPPANAEILELVPDARSVVLSDAGHFVWFDDPDRFRAEVTRFLAG
ncbi:MAG TPA: alpha/beta hydrolase [Gaiellaceae bacterium]|nr:alpha/beta hydrolase [Gaiellaceae bacterium]